jgi:hypothetical protein
VGYGVGVEVGRPVGEVVGKRVGRVVGRRVGKRVGMPVPCVGGAIVMMQASGGALRLCPCTEGGDSRWVGLMLGTGVGFLVGRCVNASPRPRGQFTWFERCSNRGMGSYDYGAWVMSCVIIVMSFVSTRVADLPTYRGGHSGPQGGRVGGLFRGPGRGQARGGHGGRFGGVSAGRRGGELRRDLGGDDGRKLRRPHARQLRGPDRCQVARWQDSDAGLSVAAGGRGAYSRLGRVVGFREGHMVGLGVGTLVGRVVGSLVGRGVGSVVGRPVGAPVGTARWISSQGRQRQLWFEVCD